jgi:hypothetical protein
MCVYLSKNHGMTMSVEKKENDLTAKGSNRISGLKKHHQLSYLIDIKYYATRQGALTFGAIVALHIWASLLSDIPVVFDLPSTQKLRRHDFRLGLRAISPAACFKSADGSTRSQRKDAAKEDAPFVHLAWTKERWNQVHGRPNTRHDTAC